MFLGGGALSLAIIAAEVAGEVAQSGWIIQTGGKTIGGYHSSQKEAAAVLAKHLGKRVRDLARKRTEKTVQTGAVGQSKYRGVAYRPGKGWVGTTVPLGAVYESATEAVDALVKIMRKRPAMSSGIDARKIYTAGKKMSHTMNMVLVSHRCSSSLLSRLIVF